MYRIGFGYDSHRFAEGRKLMLGGVQVEYNRGLLGHSDGDVLLHATADALLGAAGHGDIGMHFPDTDERYRNIDSGIIISEVVAIINEKGYRIINIDCTVIAEQPKLAPYYEKMKVRISQLLNMKDEQVNVKAKTNEGMGFVGHGEGIACFAIALLEK
ncbi:MAG: 2-C-methyl-D-erythritol 2,4-cyclodiphosphate synthase [Candidatus Fischerbacteria bacterium RBG_13_37_8]|uniref:2-C-methyl-D-erythritol 2,4-cyclodiphosphate synthase n=1 Tax=Candidatus Fischerbacteria bacterium RBG_13_37_8 TaxID=1817863 RepID=A0A1F5VVG0_9BACT|nr:MAG: 2-C-methyl-D-erythritol 2,4-cyclodiphosphate synthase [Candidatus Fischerbacteria bacterium RBG_13_37_8]